MTDFEIIIADSDHARKIAVEIKELLKKDIQELVDTILTTYLIEKDLEEIKEYEIIFKVPKRHRDDLRPRLYKHLRLWRKKHQISKKYMYYVI